jgi:hypothetical protein
MLRRIVPGGTWNIRSTLAATVFRRRWSAGMPALPAVGRSPTHPNANSPFRNLAVAAGGSTALFTWSNWSPSTGGRSTIPVTTNVDRPAGIDAFVVRFMR